MRLIHAPLTACLFGFVGWMTSGCVGQLGSIDASESSEDSATCDEVDLCPCEAPLVCSFGYCTEPPHAEPCAADDAFDMVCGANEMCFEDFDEQTACYPMPPCPVDWPCPVGEFGAVCNEGGFPVKDRICLVGMCDGPDNCPADFECIQPFAGYGVCSSGAFGEPCAQDEHCDSGSCLIFSPGIGTCL